MKNYGDMPAGGSLGDYPTNGFGEYPIKAD
jgi:hypothetical protein